MKSDLDNKLLAAHARGDKPALVDLYQEAAHQTRSKDAKAFFLTHAYIFALEIGHEKTTALRQCLLNMEREVVD